MGAFMDSSFEKPRLFGRKQGMEKKKKPPQGVGKGFNSASRKFNPKDGEVYPQ